MKKIVTLAAIAALGCGLVFADEPTANVSIAEFTGNASVEWGVDLDAGKTGFKNSDWARIRAKLFDVGSKEASGDDDIWAEIKIAIDDSDSQGFNGYEATNSSSGWKAEKPYVDVAKLHIFDFYVGFHTNDGDDEDIKIGLMDFDTALRSKGNWRNQSRWLTDVGLDGYKAGVVLGWGNSNLSAAVDFRSYSAAGQYSDNYGVAAQIKLLDSNEWVEGLGVAAGVSTNINDVYWENSTAGTAVTKAYIGDAKLNTSYHDLAYYAQASFKLGIDDKFYIKPQVGYTGTTEFVNYKNPDDSTAWSKSTTTSGTLVGALLFGWGDNNGYGNVGVPYLDADSTDRARGMTPGVSVLAYVPLASSGTYKAEKTVSKSSSSDYLKALIVPSFYLGDLVDNLRAGAYAEIGVYGDSVIKTDATIDGTNTNKTTTTTWKDKNGYELSTPFAIAAGVAYDVKADDVTVTPSFGIRFATADYFNSGANNLHSSVTNGGSNQTTMFATGADTQASSNNNMGIQRKNAYGVYAAGFLNLKLKVNVAGLINNTDFYAVYESANLLNETNYKDQYFTVDGIKYKNPDYAENGVWNAAAGRITLGAKISL